MKKKHTKFYIFGFLFAVIFPVLYIFWSFGVFSDGLMTTSVGLNSVVVFGLFVIIYKLIKDFYKHANDPNNRNAAQRGWGRALFRLLPWIIAILIVHFVHAGVADMYQHVIVISAFQVIASVFIGYEEYYKICMYFPDENQPKEE